MERAIGVASGLILLVFTVIGTALASEATYQQIAPIIHDGQVTTEYSLTNTGDTSSTYSIGFYVHITNTVEFPYRLVYQAASQALEKGETVTFTAAQYASRWTEPADTLIVNSSQSLTITYVATPVDSATQTTIWMPVCRRYAPEPAPASTLDIYQYEYVEKGVCSWHWIAREWVNVCTPDEVYYNIIVETPLAVDVMWMVGGDATSGERIRMWRYPGTQSGYTLFRAPMDGSVEYVPDQLEYEIDGALNTRAYAPACSRSIGQPTPACWTYAIPD